MTSALKPKPGFPWHRVRWDDADEPARDDCSLCGVPIDDDEVPLRLWNERKDGAVFCSACMAQWWGIT